MQTSPSKSLARCVFLLATMTLACSNSGSPGGGVGNSGGSTSAQASGGNTTAASGGSSGTSASGGNSSAGGIPVTTGGSGSGD